ncbi:methyltransferase-like protein 17, mitochondrial [Cotesia glomerata]|uniref:Methyltransferase-like protein 17, mitochondrial n=1 Tax=Cotesia glomerata TaxID=32391 RepID=A0AAV7IHE8_COTGL|nr:methyltransferase-like protein 17, mitochondrial [Cotesia glomerata]KAH0552664.1 hypothetical protein KQX54_013853 [Cotesia glomerata]
MFKKINLPLKLQSCQCATNAARKIPPVVKLNEEVNNLLKEEKLKPRKQPGVVLRTVVELPKWLIKAMKRALEEHPKKTIVQDAIELYRHLNGRHPPPEQELINQKYAEESKKLAESGKYVSLDGQDDEKVQEQLHKDTLKLLRKKVHPWAPIEYDKYRGLMYMIARGAHDYAIMYRILKEIQTRDPKFKPESLMDFGSGVGSVSWVASQFWQKSLREYMCVDASEKMCDLAGWIAKLAEPKIRNIFFKQYLPVTNDKYDIVVCAFTLMELPDRKTRIETILNLWRKTDKYLVIVDQGTNAGFKLINEARDFITNMINTHKKRELYEAFIFSPCPHELQCPRYEDGTNTPCNFEVRFFPLQFRRGHMIYNERYSYVVFKKGSSREDNDKWPRLVRETITHSRMAICRMCTSEGKLQEIIFSKGKHEKFLFRCGKKSLWGDRLPIEINNSSEVISEAKGEEIIDNEATEEVTDDEDEETNDKDEKKKLNL